MCDILYNNLSLKFQKEYHSLHLDIMIDIMFLVFCFFSFFYTQNDNSKKTNLIIKYYFIFYILILIYYNLILI